MTTRKSTGKGSKDKKPTKKPAPSGGGGDDGGDDDDDEVISFTPATGFDINIAVDELMDVMEDIGKPLVIYLPNIAIEFEPGCTREQIIDGYQQGLEASMKFDPANDPKKS